jgi:catechol 2,3-dioxygenase-like lactoylglutathione lyase family enzyme
MIDHISVGVADLARARAFYEAVLSAIGMSCLVRRETMVGFGKRYPELWLNHRPGMASVEAGTGVHICLRARSEAAVQAFHAAALAHGGSDDGAPGPREAAMTGYYAAFVRDPDGNRLEAATFPVKAG